MVCLDGNETLFVNFEMLGENFKLGPNNLLFLLKK